MTQSRVEIEEIVGRLREMGLSTDDLEKQVDQTYEGKVKLYTSAQKFQKLFSTANGKAVLELLMDQTLRRSTWLPGDNSDVTMSFGLHREGQNSIMVWILKHLEIAQAGPPKKNEPKSPLD